MVNTNLHRIVRSSRLFAQRTNRDGKKRKKRNEKKNKRRKWRKKRGKNEKKKQFVRCFTFHRIKVSNYKRLSRIYRFPLVSPVDRLIRRGIVTLICSKRFTVYRIWTKLRDFLFFFFFYVC